MEYKTIFMPSRPNKPDLLRLKTYTYANFYPVDFFFLVAFGFIYTLYRSGEFDSLDFYYGSIGLYLLIRLWPFVVTNSEIRRKNKKMIESYDKEIVKYEKSLKDYYALKARMDLEPQKKPVVRASEAEMEIIGQKLRERFKSRYSSNIKDSTLIKKNDTQLEIEINNTIRNYSGICAVLAIQPIPFADIFILTPTQILMGKKIAFLRGYEIKENSIEGILKEISGIIGMGVIAQQLVIGAYKSFLPFLGGITTIPVVYGLTYGIGKTMDYYIVAKINGRQINKNEIEKIFKTSREIGEREGKSKEKEIYSKSRKNDKN